MAREEIERIVWNEFVKFTGVEGEEDLNLEIFSIKRENFVRHLRLLFPELRLRNSFGKKTVEDFIDALFAEQIYKEKFINEVLDVVKKISGHTEYGLGNRLFEELRVRESEPETNARQAEEVKFSIIRLIPFWLMLKIYGSWQKYITEEDNFNSFRFLTTCGLGVVKRPPVFLCKNKIFGYGRIPEHFLQKQGERLKRDKRQERRALPANGAFLV